MTDVDQAVKAAIDFFQRTYGRAVSDLAVEEIEQSDTGWAVTLGFTPPGVIKTIMQQMNTLPPREYKVFKVDQKGKVLYMKIRKPVS